VCRSRADPAALCNTLERSSTPADCASRRRTPRWARTQGRGGRGRLCFNAVCSELCPLSLLPLLGPGSLPPTWVTGGRTCIMASCCPVRAFHCRSVASAPPDTSVMESGEKATLVTPEEWPYSTSCCSPANQPTGQAEKTQRWMLPCHISGGSNEQAGRPAGSRAGVRDAAIHRERCHVPQTGSLHPCGEWRLPVIVLQMRTVLSCNAKGHVRRCVSDGSQDGK
jgi:hypothetical protein